MAAESLVLVFSLAAGIFLPFLTPNALRKVPLLLGLMYIPLALDISLFPYVALFYPPL